MVNNTEIQIFDPDNPIIRHILKSRAEHAEQQINDYSHVFRPKSIWDIIRLSCIILGIELGYAATTAFVSPLLLQTGIDHKHMTMFWSISPILGFIGSPLIGSFSDHCRSSLGRRRPVIIALCLGITIGLILIPFGKNIGLLLGDGPTTILEADSLSNFTNASTIEPVASKASDYKFAIILIVLGTVLVDFDVNMAQSPCRAYILDVSIPTDHGKVLSSFTVMAGLGGSIGYVLGAIDWEATSFGSYLGGNIQAVFTIVTVWFGVCFLITVTSFREIPLPLMETDKLLRPLTTSTINKELQKEKGVQVPSNETSLKPAPEINDSSSENESEGSIACTSYQNQQMPIDPEILDDDEKPASFREYMISIIRMPKAMKILCFTNLLSWMADIVFTLYYTDFVGEAVFHGSPTAPAGSRDALLYDEGVRFGCWGMAIMAFSCSIYSALIEKLIAISSTKIVYTGGLFIFAIGMAALAFFPTKVGVLVFCIATGVIYSTLFTIPYMLVAQYHSQGCFEIRNGQKIELEERRGLGTDIAIVTSMLSLAQIIVSLGIGSIISLVQSTTAVLYAASILSAAAGISALKCVYLE